MALKQILPMMLFMRNGHTLNKLKDLLLLLLLLLILLIYYIYILLI